MERRAEIRMPPSSGATSPIVVRREFATTTFNQWVRSAAVLNKLNATAKILVVLRASAWPMRRRWELCAAVPRAKTLATTQTPATQTRCVNPTTNLLELHAGVRPIPPATTPTRVTEQDR